MILVFMCTGCTVNIGFMMNRFNRLRARLPRLVILAAPGTVVWTVLTSRPTVAWWFAGVVVAVGYVIAHVVIRVPRTMTIAGEIDLLDDESRAKVYATMRAAVAADREALGVKLKDPNKEAV